MSVFNLLHYSQCVIIDDTPFKKTIFSHIENTYHLEADSLKVMRS